MGGARPSAGTRRGASSGDRLEELYLASSDGARRLAYLLTGDQHLAEDIAQEAFVRVASRVASLRNPGALEAYLKKAVVNLVRSHHRRHALEQRVLRWLPPGSAVAQSPETELARDLWARLQRLPPRQRLALVLRYYEDLDEARVAGLMRCSRRAVNALVARGLAALREGGEDP
jgi:RNA polymerase sigma factor (sigma-70 family)